MIKVGDINEYLVTQAPESVNELLKCLRDKTDCICLKTAHYPSWSGGNQKIVVCTQNVVYVVIPNLQQVRQRRLQMTQEGRDVMCEPCS